MIFESFEGVHPQGISSLGIPGLVPLPGSLVVWVGDPILSLWDSNHRCYNFSVDPVDKNYYTPSYVEISPLENLDHGICLCYDSQTTSPRYVDEHLNCK